MFLNACKSVATRQTNLNIDFWVVLVGEGRGSGVIFLDWSAQCDPRTVSFYHSMFSCNSTTLPIL